MLLGFSAEEAASYPQLIYRYREAGDLFLGYFEGTQLVGVRHLHNRSLKYNHYSIPGAITSGAIIYSVQDLYSENQKLVGRLYRIQNQML